MKLANSWDLTPYRGNGEYESCERAVAELRIYYDNGSHEEITRILGMEPTQAHDKNEEWTSSRGNRLIHKHTLWSYRTEEICKSLDLRDHLEILLSRLDDRIKAAQKLEGVKLGVHCIWWSIGSGGPALASHQMKKLGELGLECSFDVGFFGEDESSHRQSTLKSVAESDSSEA